MFHSGQLFEFVFLSRKLAMWLIKFHICVSLTKVGMNRDCRVNMWRNYQRLSFSQNITLLYPGNFVKLVLKAVLFHRFQR